ncbi:TatD DNase family protein [Kaistella chaponensis]|uniref:TatD DNase family protein n=1 Tax=Kaistella chaponensis TaxID=713588 RepID=A0A1N7KXK4_9FLAO|nr:TatD family hydrolase [Kaistella chaponensis]SIS66304.1 TatD DNase family protein [Kaistella chaponensis]
MNFFDFHHHNFEKECGIFNLKFNDELPESIFSAGIHPHSISLAVEDEFLWLKEISKLSNCVAIGECGLDGLVDVEEKLQEEVFERQVYLANEIKKPLIIHCVRRFSRLIHFRKLSKVPMIVHGFNKRKTIGDDLLKNDFYLSFGKSVLYNVNLQEFLKEFPLDRLFLETDSADFQIVELYQKVASLKNIEPEELLKIVKQNLQNIQISI